ncbi:MAG: hypothetical protein R3C03_22785 [Pirellulaceae bacterium]
MKSIVFFLTTCACLLAICFPLAAQDELLPGGLSTAHELNRTLSPPPTSASEQAGLGYFIEEVSASKIKVTQPGTQLYIEIDISQNKQFLLFRFPCMKLPSNPKARYEALDLLMKQNIYRGLMRFELYDNDIFCLTYPIRNENITTETLVRAMMSLFDEVELTDSVWRLKGIDMTGGDVASKDSSSSDSKTKEMTKETNAKSKANTKTTAEEMPSKESSDVKAESKSPVERLANSLKGSELHMAMVEGPAGSGVFGMATFSPSEVGQFSWEINMPDGAVKTQGNYKLDGEKLTVIPDGDESKSSTFKFKSYDQESNRLEFEHPSGISIVFTIKS